MRLQSLEIKGFKSFANQTTINFNEDVIGIVGPNGSGKSNIVDAVRWVLGEQKSKELRLEKMTNVIFNGTKKRKASGLAQVSLTFENTKNLLPTEYNTVELTRILYSSGESEYRLNNVVCRLKDIRSLFLDTGIGSNSYAIIALGMVDDILTDKENSRRRMFEQAAGISKYKTRKRETLNKLKNTEGDLDRIEDLLFEIEGNLKSLEKQAKRTKKYFQLKEQYKELSINLAVFKLGSYSARHKEVTAALDKAEDELRQLDIDIHTFDAQLETAKKGNVDKEKDLSESQKELNNLVSKIRTTENDKRILEQKRQFINQNLEKLKSQIGSAEKRIEQLAKDVEYYRSELNTEKEIESTLEEELTEAKSSLQQIQERHGSLKTELDDFMKNQQTLEREVFELEKNKAVNKNQIDNLTNEIKRSQEDIDERTLAITDLSTKLSALELKETAELDLFNSLEKEEAFLQDEIKISDERLEQLTKSMAEVNRKLDAKRNEFKLTKSMVENLEGFPESIKFLTNNADWDNKAPLLSDLLYVNEEYRVAIENYLDPYLNYYVVKSVEEAENAIRLLSKSQKGKANFFILDAIQAYQSPVIMLANTKRAIDLIQVDPQYQVLIDMLMDNVLVTERDDMLSLQLDNKDTVLLAKSGAFVRRKFSLSGGSVGLFEGKKIGRKKNLEKLEMDIKSLETEENTISTDYYNLKAKLENLKEGLKQNEIIEKRNLLNQLGQEKVSLLTRLENFRSFLTDVNNKRTTSEETILRLNLENKEIDVSLDEKKASMEKARASISSTDGSFRRAAEELSLASNDFNEKNIDFVRQQNKVNAYQRELSFRENQIRETDESLSTNKSAIQNAGDEDVEIKEEIEQLATLLLSEYELKKEKETTLSAAEQNYFQARGGINEIEDNVKKVNRQRQETQQKITNLKDKFNEIKLEFSSIGERLKIEFDIKIEDILENEVEVAENFNGEEVEIKVDRLKTRLNNYGEINPMAVEAYDEMDERYQTITAQRDDIVEAKKSLLETIKEIESTATDHFMNAFNQVREYFIDVFRSLFTEDDSCDLILEDPENPLDSKIKIIARPKGKRPQSINQLSGGEKTLTATALLFALYLLKPAPFCIFDEVDAPLDDANIEKFNKIIKKFSKESQFIIVTHNKMTMAAVDIIYGVYMQEQGVSGVSAVDFRELEHTSTLEVVDN